MKTSDTTKRLTTLAALLLFTAATPSTALDIDELRATNLNAAEEWFENQKAVAKTNTNWKMLPRIRIDLKAPEVTFKAEATGLAPNDIVEFFLIGERSGNAYEAIAVALAEPKDIANAIEKMGLPRGRHADPNALRFWPEGERVHVYFNEHHAADLMLDKRTGSTTERAGFVFTASRQVERDGNLQLAAQVEPPFSIAANYNEPNTILDVPFRAPQAEVYTLQVQNPDIRFEPGQLLTVRIIPENTDGSKRVQRMNLKVFSTDTATRIPLTDLRFTLRSKINHEAPPLLAAANPEAFLSHIRDRVAQQKDPFVTLNIDHDLSLAQAHSMARLIEVMENKEGLRILPPPADTLYYRAFIPDESRRERAERMAHPWELHLSYDAPPILVHIEEEWIRGEPRPQITTQDITVKEPEILADQMRELRPNINAVFIYAPQNMLVGNIMEIVQNFQETHPLIHVFMTPPPRAQTSGATRAATSE